ncbi:polyketide synthase dehydratase-domain-containing protein [Lasiosphaeria miniovina]|uniref:Polyketide synthase dehydratase-domain-containing protein n=1 Tax=Lasiosphaeria miniovina TaxID=1954250 RepID=A0AA40A6H3_9PEZI|nr:polyketide synthase dehydratase-domain-containing protein [Lasiosphaeria miniovina]KAK0710110.1 polyketide synthase dehydratase-domain-containing protein [Lasiosphaeria miniovina]
MTYEAALRLVDLDDDQQQQQQQQQPPSIRLIEMHNIDIVRIMALEEDSSGLEVLFTVYVTSQSATSITTSITTSVACYSGAINTASQQLDTAQAWLTAHFTSSVRVLLGAADKKALPYRTAPLLPLDALDMDAVYASLDKEGFNYSDLFRAKSMLRRLNHSVVTVSDPPPPVVAGTAVRASIHPAPVDTAIQGLLAGFSFPGDGRIGTTYLPTRIESVRISMAAPSKSESGPVLTADSVVMSADGATLTGDIDIFDAADGHTEVQLRGVRMKAVGQRRTDRWLESELYEQLVRTAYFYSRHLRSKIRPVELMLMGKFRKHRAAQPADNNDMNLLHAMGQSLVPIVRGTVPPLKMLVQDGMLDRLYFEGLGFKDGNVDLGAVVGQLGHQHPRMRIVEVGAGTGNITRTALSALGTRYSQYTYTDISTGFFENGRSIFSAPASRLAFKTLNIENDPSTQGLLPASLDTLPPLGEIVIIGGGSKLATQTQALLRAAVPTTKAVAIIPSLEEVGELPSCAAVLSLSELVAGPAFRDMTAARFRAKSGRNPEANITFLDIDDDVDDPVAAVDPSLLATLFLCLAFTDDRQTPEEGPLWPMEPELALKGGAVYIPRVVSLDAVNRRSAARHRPITQTVSLAESNTAAAALLAERPGGAVELQTVDHQQILPPTSGSPAGQDIDEKQQALPLLQLQVTASSLWARRRSGRRHQNGKNSAKLLHSFLAQALAAQLLRDAQQQQQAKAAPVWIHGAPQGLGVAIYAVARDNVAFIHPYASERDLQPTPPNEAPVALIGRASSLSAFATVVNMEVKELMVGLSLAELSSLAAMQQVRLYKEEDEYPDDKNKNTVTAVVRPLSHSGLFSPDKTYLLFGMTGDLGISVSGRMVAQGARHIVLASRAPRVPSSVVSYFATHHGAVSAYAGANHFMAGLARSRRGRGLAASIVHISVLTGLGYIFRRDAHYTSAIDKALLPRLVRQAQTDLHEMLAEAIMGGRPNSGSVAELITGKRLEDKASQERATSAGTVSVQVQLVAAGDDSAGALSVLQERFTQALGAMLEMDAEQIDGRGPVASLGIDLLVVIRIRSSLTYLCDDVLIDWRKRVKRAAEDDKDKDRTRRRPRTRSDRWLSE